MNQDEPDANSLRKELPLTPVAFEILLSLAAGARHGYAVMSDVRERSGGALTLHPGTLYRALNRLLDQRWIEELDQAPEGASADERRRYYCLTERGRQVAEAEALRLSEQAAAARRLLRGEEGG
ncbi:MAG TPA: helix-turn-helix transcriptional regulator [Acidobacteriota bacterium]|nr:helix-turn-helix transcriptional regulator [Acidobacteriota bacterium]